MKHALLGGSSRSFRSAFCACGFIFSASRRTYTLLFPSLGTRCAVAMISRTWSTLIATVFVLVSGSVKSTSGWTPRKTFLQSRQTRQGRVPESVQSMAAASSVVSRSRCCGSAQISA